MQKALVVLFSAILLVGILSCNKEENPQPQTKTYDTLFPHPALPTWPGSYWVYNTGDTLKALDYKLIVYNKAAYDALPEYDTLVVVRLQVKNIFNLPDTFAFLKNNELSRPRDAFYRTSSFIPLFSKTPGIFYVSQSWQGHALVGETLTVDTCVTVGMLDFERVFVVQWFDNAAAQMFGKQKAVFKREFWVENVGLIRRDEKPVPSDPENFISTLLLRGWVIHFPPDK
ncbi:MAG: hypothetical protein ACP5O2_06555 [Bacteroidales bacterium]